MPVTSHEQMGGCSRRKYFGFAALLLIPVLSQSPESSGRVEVALTDINDARIVNATVIFRNRANGEFIANNHGDGTYVLVLKPGTYAMEMRSRGFCTVRRGKFRLTERSSVQFESQMWVCPSDMQFIEYAELEEVPGTRLKPLVLHGKKEKAGRLRRFWGPNAIDDGTEHKRKCPAILTFNLLTLVAETIEYDRQAAWSAPPAMSTGMREPNQA